MDAVRHGERPWASHDELRAEALRSVVTNHPEGNFSVDALEEAALFGRRVEPFADSVPAVETMRGDHPVFALTNGSAATMAEMSERTGLEWTQLISADEVQTFKPNPEMYERMRVRGGLEPGRTLFVAAHPWDLDAAKRHGYRTALVLRPGVLRSAGRYDYEARDLNEIAEMVGRLET